MLASLCTAVCLAFVLGSCSLMANFIVGGTLFQTWDHVMSEDENGKDFGISDYSFDAQTGRLRFNFTYSYDYHNGEPIQISGKVNVIVYEVPVV